MHTPTQTPMFIYIEFQWNAQKCVFWCHSVGFLLVLLLSLILSATNIIVTHHKLLYLVLSLCIKKKMVLNSVKFIYVCFGAYCHKITLYLRERESQFRNLTYDLLLCIQRRIGEEETERLIFEQVLRVSLSQLFPFSVGCEDNGL